MLYFPLICLGIIIKFIQQCVITSKKGITFGSSISKQRLPSSEARAVMCTNTKHVPLLYHLSKMYSSAQDSSSSRDFYWCSGLLWTHCTYGNSTEHNWSIPFDRCSWNALNLLEQNWTLLKRAVWQMFLECTEPSGTEMNITEHWHFEYFSRNHWKKKNIVVLPSLGD